MEATFQDEVHQGDTLQRAGYLRNRRTQALEELNNHVVSYSARIQGGTGSPTITAQDTGGPGDFEVAPLASIPDDATPGVYDAWIHIVAPGGALVSTIQGVLTIRERPT